MCNYLHVDSKSIPKEGNGYKLVHFDKKKILSCVNSTQYKGKHVVWSGYDFSGFCFFLSLKEAKRAQMDWAWEVPNFLEPRRFPAIIEIEYKKGLGQHREKGFIVGHSYQIALCREIKFGKVVAKGRRKKANEWYRNYIE
jgi:hypothetical protein